MGNTTKGGWAFEIASRRSQFSKRPRAAKTSTAGSFAMSTDRNGEVKFVRGSAKRPGRLKWAPRLSADLKAEADPAVTGRSRTAQSKKLAAASGLTPQELCLREEFGGYRQAF